MITVANYSTVITTSMSPEHSSSLYGLCGLICATLFAYVIIGR